jgi:hypothetical protein
MENPFTVQSQGEYRYSNGRGEYVVTGFDIRRFIGTGTATEIVGRPLHPTEKTPWGTPREMLWTTAEEASAAAARATAGNTTGISFASYSND